jgi:hypothetical protein
MSRLAEITFLCIFAVGAVAQSGHHQISSDIDGEQTAWVANSLRVIQTIKVGMTRSNLMRVFVTEGGLSQTSQRTYVYRRCPFIKVDVKFAASSRDEELPTDRIVEVSRPYLAWSVTD